MRHPLKILFLQARTGKGSPFTPDCIVCALTVAPWLWRTQKQW